MRALFGLVALLSVVGGASAREVRIDDVTFRVDPPAGYCEFDKTIKSENDYLTNMGNAQAGAGNSLIAIFPDCQELAAYRARNETLVTRLLIVATTSNLGKSQTDLVNQVCQSYKEEGKKLLAQTDPKSKALMKKHLAGDLASDVFLGVLENKPGVCYSGQITKIRSDGKETTVLNVFAATLLRNSLIFIYSYKPYSDANSVQPNLANLKTIYTCLAAANAAQ